MSNTATSGNYKKTAILQQLQQAIKRKVNQKSKSRGKDSQSSKLMQPQTSVQKRRTIASSKGGKSIVSYVRSGTIETTTGDNSLTGIGGNCNNMAPTQESQGHRTQGIKSKNPVSEFRAKQNSVAANPLHFQKNNEHFIKPPSISKHNHRQQTSSKPTQKSSDTVSSAINSIRNTFQMINNPGVGSGSGSGTSSNQQHQKSHQKTHQHHHNKKGSSSGCRKWDKLLSTINYLLSSSQKVVKHIDSSNFEADFSIKLYRSDRENLINEVRHFKLQEVFREMKMLPQGSESGSGPGFGSNKTDLNLNHQITNKGTKRCPMQMFPITIECPQERLQHHFSENLLIQENNNLKKEIMLLEKQAERFHKGNLLLGKNQEDKATLFNSLSTMHLLDNIFKDILYPQGSNLLVDILEKQYKFEQIKRQTTVKYKVTQGEMSELEQILRSLKKQKLDVFVENIQPIVVELIDKKHINALERGFGGAISSSRKASSNQIEKQTLLREIQELKMHIQPVKLLQGIKIENNQLKSQFCIFHDRLNLLWKQIAQLEQQFSSQSSSNQRKAQSYPSSSQSNKYFLQIEDIWKDIEKFIQKKINQTKPEKSYSKNQSKQPSLCKKCQQLQTQLSLMQASHTKEIQTVKQQIFFQITCEYEDKLQIQENQVQNHKKQLLQKLSLAENRLSQLEQELFSKQEILKSSETIIKGYEQGLKEQDQSNQKYIKVLKFQIQGLQNQLQGKSNQIQHLQNDLKKCSSKLQATQEQLNQYKVVNIGLKSQLEQSSSKVSSLVDKIDFLEQQLQNYKNMNLQIKERAIFLENNEIKVNNQHHAQIQALSNKYIKEISKLNQILENLKSEKQEQSKQQISIKMTELRKSFQKEKATIKTEAQNIRKKYQAEIDILKSQLGEKRTENDQLSSQIKEKQAFFAAKINKIQAQNAAERKAIIQKANEQKQSQFHQQLQKITLTSENNQSLFLQKQGQYQERIKRQCEQIQDLNQKISFKIQSEVELRQKCSELQSKETAQSEKIIQLNSTITDLKEQIFELTKNLASKIEQLQFANSDIDSLNEELELQKGQREEDIHEIQELKNSTQNLISSFENDIRALQSKLDHQTVINKNLESQINATKDSSEKGKSSIQSANQKLNTKITELFSKTALLQSQNMNLQQKLKEGEIFYEQIKIQLNQALSINDSLKSQLTKQSQQHKQKVEQLLNLQSQNSNQLEKIKLQHSSNLLKLQNQNRKLVTDAAAQATAAHTASTSSSLKAQIQSYKRQLRQQRQANQLFQQELNLLRQQKNQQIEIHNLKLTQYSFFIKKILESTQIQMEDLKHQTRLDVLLSTGSQRIVQMKRRIRDQESNKKKIVAVPIQQVEAVSIYAAGANNNSDSKVNKNSTIELSQLEGLGSPINAISPFSEKRSQLMQQQVCSTRLFIADNENEGEVEKKEQQQNSGQEELKQLKDAGFINTSRKRKRKASNSQSTMPNQELENPKQDIITNNVVMPEMRTQSKSESEMDINEFNNIKCDEAEELGKPCVSENAHQTIYAIEKTITIPQQNRITLAVCDAASVSNSKNLQQQSKSSSVERSLSSFDNFQDYQQNQSANSSMISQQQENNPAFRQQNQEKVKQKANKHVIESLSGQAAFDELDDFKSVNGSQEMMSMSQSQISLHQQQFNNSNSDDDISKNILNKSLLKKSNSQNQQSNKDDRIISDSAAFDELADFNNVCGGSEQMSRSQISQSQVQDIQQLQQLNDFQSVCNDDHLSRSEVSQYDIGADVDQDNSDILKKEEAQNELQEFPDYQSEMNSSILSQKTVGIVVSIENEDINKNKSNQSNQI